MLQPKIFRTYGYRFQEGPVHPVAQIDSLGWDRKTTPDYRFDGMQRAESGMYLFQYTLSGKGALAHDGKASCRPVPLSWSVCLASIATICRMTANTGNLFTSCFTGKKPLPAGPK